MKYKHVKTKTTTLLGNNLIDYNSFEFVTFFLVSGEYTTQTD